MVRIAGVLSLVAVGACLQGPKPRTRGQLCPADLCGEPSDAPTYRCSDGSFGGPTHRCVSDEVGVCDWEVKTCEHDPPPCVRGGCEGELCIEMGSEQLGACDYGERLQCEWRGICERQQDGSCGFTENDEVRKCKRFGPQD